MLDVATHGNSKRRRVFIAAIAAAALVASLAIGACSDDGRSEPNMPENDVHSDRPFRDIQAVDVAPRSAGGQCSDMGAISDGQASMRLVFFDGAYNVTPLKPGEYVGYGPEVEVAPTRGDVAFSDGKLYALPDLRCDGPDECEPMLCQDPDTDDPDRGDRCMFHNVEISVDDDPRFVGKEPQSQAIAVAMSNFGRWRGFYSGDFSGVHIFDPEGSNPSLPSGTVGEVAVDGDHTRYRFSALRDMAYHFESLVDYVEEEDREAHFGFWTFGETRSEVLSEVQEASPQGRSWTTSPTVADDVTSNLGDPQQGRSSIYLAMEEVLQQAFVGNSDVEDADHRAMVFLVSGYDEIRQDSIQDIIDDANFHDVEISIIQVDTPREVGFLRDDPRYYRDQNGCSDDSECAHFETCREPTWYTQEPDSNSEDDVWRPRADDRGQAFCLPHYEPDEDGMGQLGPIADYQRIACETGGAYTYVPTADRELIGNPLQAQIWSGEGAWEIDFTIDDFHGLEPAGDGADRAYLLETVLDVTIGRQNSLGFEYDGDDDRRRAFFTPPN